MAKASRDGVVLADSSDTIFLEGNNYFPPGSINWDHLHENKHRTTCPWKGMATYYDVEVDGKVIKNAGWTYRTPNDAAQPIKDHVAFYRRFAIFGKVTIED
jgi:uncharacterized protein (DUF427 family)